MFLAVFKRWAHHRYHVVWYCCCEARLKCGFEVTKDANAPDTVKCPTDTPPPYVQKITASAGDEDVLVAKLSSAHLQKYLDDVKFPMDAASEMISAAAVFVLVESARWVDTENALTEISDKFEAQKHMHGQLMKGCKTVLKDSSGMCSSLVGPPSTWSYAKPTKSLKKRFGGQYGRHGPRETHQMLLLPRIQNSHCATLFVDSS